MLSAQKQLGVLVLHALQKASEAAAQAASKSGLFVNRTGRLQKSIDHKMLGKFRARTSAKAKHAAWVEHGNTFKTGAQYIYPKNGKFLKFHIDGRTVFARRVKASKPRPFMNEAARKTEPLFVRLCNEAIQRMFG